MSLRQRRSVVWLVHLAPSACFLPAILLAVVRRRFRRRRERPRVLFGITPIINSQYWSGALRARGYESRTFIYDQAYVINSADDFDARPETLMPGLARVPGFRLARQYLSFMWALENVDVVVLDFDGGFLRGTPLQYLEFGLARLAGQRIVGIPYGSDAIDLRRCPDAATRTAMLEDYPLTGRDADRTARRVKHYGRWADYIVCGGHMFDYLPRWDLLVASPLAVDT
jgi:hypothetical protein